MPRIADERKPDPKPEIISALKEILPENLVLSKTAEVVPYECDGLSAIRQRPLVVALPKTIEQVQDIMRLCHKMRVPVVARGAGTGLSGGALPLEDGVLLSLAKFNQIIHIDPDNLSARVQPGVRNLAISEAAEPYGLYYAPDPSSQIACSIGGNVAENSGGVHCLKYGLTVHNILSLTLVDVEGEIFHIGNEALDSSGLDPLALMTGSEGMLAIIVEITVKLLPQPERAQALLAAFDDVAKAGEAVTNIIASGTIPAGLEMMDSLAIRAAEDFAHAGYPRDAAAILICELDGTNEEVSEEVMLVRQILMDSGATEVRTAKDEAERQLFWKGRKSAFPAVGRISPDYYCMDGTIPRSQLPFVLQNIDDLSQHYNLRVANVFHAGDGNLHPLILFDANKPGELTQAEELGGEIIEACIAAGGSLSGEHGIGLEKMRYMPLVFTRQTLETMARIKCVFNPDQRLNPGKIIPLRGGWAEFRQRP